MEQTNAEPNNPKQTSWADVMGAIAEAEASKVERETVEEVLELPLTEADLAAIARENAEADAAKSEHQRVFDDFKAKMKESKAAIDALEAQIKARHSDVRRGVHSVKKHWLVDEIFSLNVVRYLDPETGQIVHERSMSTAERQTELALDAALSTIAKAADEVAPAPNDDASVTDPAALLEAAERGSEMDLGREELDEDADEDDFSDEDE